jgi:hypothetical protein
MRGRKLLWTGVLVLVFIALVPQLALAQSGIAGVVKDTSGAVLPGVTVEAASPALIERVRSAVTDSDGTYKIGDLRPGLYSVTFALAGFSTVKRDGIDLPAAFTATVSVDLAVGSVEETITVSGAAPLVDVQNVTSNLLLSKQLIEALPAARSPQALASLMPGVKSPGLGVIPGGVSDMGNAAHGGANSDYQIDGLTTATVNGFGGGSIVFRVAQAYTAEVNVMTGGGMAESAYGSMVANVIPKEGGNAFSGLFYADFTNSSLATSNLTEKLRLQGLTADSLTKLAHLHDVSVALGGRLLRDKLWFFSSFRTFGVSQTRVGVWDNLTPLGNAYTPDLSRPSVARLKELSRSTRLTWQATPKNKFAVFVDAAPQVAFHRGYTNSNRISQEATNYSPYLPNTFMSASWKSTVTNKWLLESTAARNYADYDQRRQTDATCQCNTPIIGYDVISKNETSTNTQWGAGSFPISTANNYGHNAGHIWQSINTASYITGSHNVKVGVQFQRGGEWVSVNPNGGLAYTFKNGAPSSITQYASPIVYQNNMHANIGTFVQDQWTYKRLTATGGLRDDYFTLDAAAEHLPEGLFVPARDFPKASLVHWNDLNPRLGASYDLFGDGKTAIKVTHSRFIASQPSGAGGLGSNNPVIRSVLVVSRSWKDTTGNFSPACDLKNPLMNGDCGQISDLNFGQNNPNAITYNDKLTHGLRSANWETTALVQRQLAKSLSVSAGYYRRTFGNFMVTDNTLVTPADYTEYCITAPSNPQLPQGGGNRICGLYDLNPFNAAGVLLFGKNLNVINPAAQYGKQTQIFEGVDLTENIRLPKGATISGGVSWGRTKTSSCFVVNSPGALRFCDITPPLLPSATFVGFVPLPWGLLTSATYRDFPGPQLTATYNVSNAQIKDSLGRDLSSGPNGTVNVELIKPGTLYGSRARQVDLRVSKRFQLGRNRVMGNVDIFNLLNKGTGIDSWNVTYGPDWQKPLLLQLGRYFKFGAQFDF